MFLGVVALFVFINLQTSVGFIRIYAIKLLDKHGSRYSRKLLQFRKIFSLDLSCVECRHQIFYLMSHARSYRSLSSVWLGRNAP